ncbi:MAG: hypothetical protein COA86_02665 [Kangiella sp.]|nr:MAG: hypothetical protein COA86_02665 [Kangiella sp.]
MNKSLLAIAGFLLCGGSLFCSVALWVGMQNGLFATVLAGVFSGALEICKFVFFPIAIGLWIKSKWFSFFLLLLAAFLLLVSIVATVSFLESAVIADEDEKLKQSMVYKITEAELLSLNNELTTLNKLIDKDAEAGYRKRAYQESGRLKELHELIGVKVKELGAVGVGVNGGGLFHAVAKVLGETDDNVRLVVFSLVAVLVDVCGITCLIVVSRVDVKAQQAITKSVLVSTDGVSIKEKIATGVYGRKLIVRNIVAKEKISYPVLKRTLSELINDGVVKKISGRYELVGD